MVKRDQRRKRILVKRKNLRGKYKYEYTMEIEDTIQKILSKKEVDEEAYELRDTLYELMRLEMRNLLNQKEVNDGNVR